jgi:SdrD B-like domain
MKRGVAQMKKLYIATSFVVFTLLFIGQAYGWHSSGKVYCDVNNNGIIDSTDTPVANVKVSVDGISLSYHRETTTDANGYYYLPLYWTPNSYSTTIGPEGLPSDAIVVIPASNPFAFTITSVITTMEVNWLISSQTCQAQAGACWMTAGGVKFDPALGIDAAERGPKFNFGGNTFPGCSPTAGDGGQWSFVDRALDIHFQAWVIDKVECGNVSGIPPGSTSPVTPFNYIEFSGSGTVKPVAGNGVAAGRARVSETQEVSFWARFEDRNEPGNGSALDPFDPAEGAKIDRLYLRVWTADGTIVYLIDADGNAATVDPVLITGGNIQIHISSCP